MAKSFAKLTRSVMRKLPLVEESRGTASRSNASTMEMGGSRST